MTLSIQVRPPLEARMSFIVPQQHAEAMDAIAAGLHVSRAEVLRALVAEFLRQQGAAGQ